MSITFLLIQRNPSYFVATWTCTVVFKAPYLPHFTVYFLYLQLLVHKIDCRFWGESQYRKVDRNWFHCFTCYHWKQNSGYLGYWALVQCHHYCSNRLCVCVSVFVICSSRFDRIHFQSQPWCAAIPALGCAPAHRPTLWPWAWAL